MKIIATRGFGRYLAFAVVLACVVLGVVAISPQQAQAYSIPESEAVNWSYPNFKRLAGGSALTTMKAVVDEGWDSSEWAVVATSGGYHDALSASGLAGLLKAPVMLTPKDSLSNVTKNLIVNKKVKNVIVVGGAEAVSAKAFSQIKALGVSVKRVAGGTAASTARAVYKEGLAHGGWGKDAVLATSTSFQDALSIAPYAYAKHAPVFLTDLDKTTAGGSTVALAKKFSRTLVVGGTAAVASSADKALGNAKRLAGGTAYSTSAAVAKFCLANGMGAKHAGAATGKAYHDALAGAALCGKSNSVMVLSDEGSTAAVSQVLAKRKGDLSEKWSYIFGGTDAFSSKALKPLKDWNELRDVSEDGEMAGLEKCNGCQQIFNVDGLNEHLRVAMDAYLAKIDGLPFAEYLQVPGPCGSWANLYYEVKGGTKVYMMSDGSKYAERYNMDGTIVREL